MCLELGVAGLLYDFYSLFKQLVGCDWYIAWCKFRVRRLEEVDIKIPGQETSPEHEVLVLDFSL